MRRFGILLLMLMLAPALTLAGKVTVDFDREFDFQTVRSVSWGEGGTDAQSELDQNRILRAVESSLTATGLELRERGTDLIVVTHAVIGSKTKNKGGGLGVGVFKSTSWGGVSIGGGGGGSRSKQVPVGTLQVQLLDAVTGTLVWEGLARDALVGNPAKAEARINKAVERMFREYPKAEAEEKKQKKK
jgi:hypothetical protein